MAGIDTFGLQADKRFPGGTEIRPVFHPDGYFVQAGEAVHGGVAAKQAAVGQKEGNGVFRMPGRFQNASAQSNFQRFPVFRRDGDKPFFQ